MLKNGLIRLQPSRGDDDVTSAGNRVPAFVLATISALAKRRSVQQPPSRLYHLEVEDPGAQGKAPLPLTPVA